MTKTHVGHIKSHVTIYKHKNDPRDRKEECRKASAQSIQQEELSFSQKTQPKKRKAIRTTDYYHGERR